VDRRPPDRDGACFSTRTGSAGGDPRRRGGDPHRPACRAIWGVRLVLLTDERGLPLGYTLVPANEHEYEPLADLLTGTPAEVVVADKGFWGRAYAERLAADGTRLLTPTRVRTAANNGRERALAPTRLVIESVFANLKG
jgi:hypothetical protein